MSQQLMAEGEDIYASMQKFVPTVMRKLSTQETVTPKGTATDYAQFWTERLPAQLEKLERLCPFNGGASGYLPGELYLFSMLYQATLVDASCLGRFSKLGKWFNALKAHKKTQRVLSGKSSMGALVPYFISPDSDKYAGASDQGGRWG
jgi:hypothetical protein